MSDASVYLFAALIPYFTKTLGMTYFEAGLAWTVANIFGSLPQPFLGAISDRLKSYRLAGIGVVMIVVFLGPVGFVNNLVAIIALAVVVGLGIALIHAVGAAFTGAASGGRRGAALSVFSVGGLVGSAVAPSTLPPLIQSFGPQASAAIVPVGLLVAIPLLVASSRLKQVKQHHSRVAVSGTSLRLPLLPVSLVVLSSVFRQWVGIPLITYLPIYLNSRGFALTTSAQLLALWLVMGAVGSVVGGALSDRFSPKWGTILSHVASAALFVVFFTTSGPVSIAALALSGFFVNWAMPVSIVMAQKLMPNNQALASGLTLGLGIGGGGAIGISTTGWMADVFGIGFAVSSLTIMALLGGIVMLAYREPRQAAAPEPRATTVGA